MDEKYSPGGNPGQEQRATSDSSITHNVATVKFRLREYLHAKSIEITHTGFIRCPFHDDKSPSCKVNDDYVHCFACGESGDVYRVAAALIGIPCDKEHFRKIASEVEQTLGIPEWKPTKRTKQNPSGFKLSQSTVFRHELLKDFAAAIDSGDMERAYNRAHLLFAFFMLPEDKPDQEKDKQPLRERIAAYGIRGRHE